MRLPCVAGTLSSATKLKWSNIDQSLAEMLFLDASPAGMTDFSSGWTEADSSGTNVNISSGILSIQGNNALGSNGVRHTAGIARNIGYFEADIKLADVIAFGLYCGINNSAAFPSTINTSVYGISAANLTLPRCISVSSVVGAFPISANTYYTLRIYIGKLTDGTFKSVKITISGGSIVGEYVIGDEGTTSIEVGSTMYLFFQRYSNDTDLTYIKNPKWYSGYATDGPYLERVHDAGSGNTFINFDPTSLALPGSVASTNLKFAYSFDDGTESFSSWLTLAQLNAVTKISERHRYIRLRTQLNSDGSTQVYGAIPNADTATDGIGDFPTSDHVTENDTVIGVTGGIPLSNVAVESGGTAVFGGGVSGPKGPFKNY